MEELKSTPNDDGRGRLKQLFDQEEAAPMPETWAAIESRVQKPGRKGTILWFTLALVGLLALVGTLYNWPTESNDQLSSATQAGQTATKEAEVSRKGSTMSQVPNGDESALTQAAASGEAISTQVNTTTPAEPETTTKTETKSASDLTKSTSPKTTQPLASTPVVISAEEKPKPSTEVKASTKAQTGKVKPQNKDEALTGTLASGQLSKDAKADVRETADAETHNQRLKSLKSKSGSYKAPALKSNKLNLTTGLQAGSLLAQSGRKGKGNIGQNSTTEANVQGSGAKNQSAKAPIIPATSAESASNTVSDAANVPAKEVSAAISKPEKPTAEATREEAPADAKKPSDSVASETSTHVVEKPQAEKNYRFWLSAQLMRTQQQMTIGQTQETNISAFTLSPNGRVAAGLTAQYALLSRAKWSVWAGAHIRYQQWQASYTQRQETGFRTVYSGNEMTLVPTYAFSQHELAVREWQLSPTISTRISVWKPLQLGLSASYLLSVNQSVYNNTGSLKVNPVPGHLLLSPSMGYSIGPWQVDLGIDWPLGTTQNAGQVQWQQQSYFLRISRFW